MPVSSVTGYFKIVSEHAGVGDIICRSKTCHLGRIARDNPPTGVESYKIGSDKDVQLSRRHLSIEWEDEHQRWVMYVIGKNRVTVNKVSVDGGDSKKLRPVALETSSPIAISIARVKFFLLFAQ